MNLLKKIAKNKHACKPVIYGVSGPVLTDEEKRFFSKNGAVGFILFARNVENKIQLKNLTDSLREVMDGEVLVLVDQEGGRVARLKAPHWKSYPNGQYFADIYKKNPADAKKKQKVVETKEIKMSINIGKNDFDVKIKQVSKFIEHGDKVKISVRMKGREITHLDLAKEMMQNILTQTENFAKPEFTPKLEGMQIIAILVKK